MLGKIGLLWSIFGLAVTIPIALSASTLTVSPAEYRIGYTNGSFTSDKPISAAFEGGVYGESVSSGPGYADAVLLISLNAGDCCAVFVSNGAEMIYYFEVEGASGEHVPVDVSFSGYATAAVDEGASISSIIIGSVTGPGVSYFGEACADTTGACIPPTPLGSTTLEVTAGNEYEIDLTATVSGHDSCIGCAAIGHAHIDPYLRIDPSFPGANEFNLVISDGVPNVPLTIPEPSTWALLLVGFGGLYSVGYRRGHSGAGSLAFANGPVAGGLYSVLKARS